MRTKTSALNLRQSTKILLSAKQNKNPSTVQKTILFCLLKTNIPSKVDFEQISVIKSILDGADIPFYENLVYKWQYFRIGSLQAAAGSHSFAKFEEFKLEI